LLAWVPVALGHPSADRLLGIAFISRTEGWDSMARVLRRVGPRLMLTALVVVSVLGVTTLQQPDAVNPACPDQQSSWAAGCKG